MQPSIRWHTAAPLWPAALQTDRPAHFKQPAILRFTGDAFMEDLAAQLTGAPEKLVDYVARRETWRDSEAAWRNKAAFAHKKPVKLYQPIHGRFYLATASLICRLPGLPDRLVEPPAEQTFFVLRKLVARQAGQAVDPTGETGYDEYGWQNEAWRPVANRRQVAETEERLPLFFVSFRQHQQPRRLLAGLIPVARAETYQAAPTGKAEPDGAGDGAEEQTVALLMAHFETAVSSPLRALEAAVNKELDDSESVSEPNLTPAQARETLVLALLDLVEFLQDHLPAVWQALSSEDSGPGSSGPQQALVADLTTTTMGGGIAWAEALKDIAANETALINDPQTAKLVIDPFITPAGESDAAHNSALAAIRDIAVNKIDLSTQGDFQANLETALQNSPPSLPAGLENLKAMSPDERQDQALYVIRCVYERPACLPAGLAGPLKERLAPRQRLEQIVSDPSPAFRLASFFDADAPARPARISLPGDVSPANLRQFPKNVSVTLTRELQKQFERAQGEALSALNQDGDGLSLGLICSFSLPIVTICALILLLVIVQLLNIVFWWLPFFKICLPFPGQGD